MIQFDNSVLPSNRNYMISEQTIRVVPYDKLIFGNII